MNYKEKNLKLFSWYKALSWDYLFYATISFLFLTQVKKIEAADVIMLTAISSFLGIVFQIPATIIVEKFKRKNSIVFASFLRCVYMFLFMISQNFYQLIFAEIITVLAGDIKSVVDSSFLNSSIPDTDEKNNIFSKINSRGCSWYYYLNSVSLIISGYLYSVNPYIPITLSLVILIIVFLISLNFVEPVDNNKVKDIKIRDKIKELKEGVVFVYKSPRLRALMIYISILYGLYSSLGGYEINLIKEYNISSIYIGIIFSILGFIRGFATKNELAFNRKFQNRTLSITGMLSALQYIYVGIVAIFIKKPLLCIILILIGYMIRYITSGISYASIERYLRNFANEEIDTKIFTVKSICASITTTIISVVASCMLRYFKTSEAMIVFGMLFTILFLFVLKYMKKRVGLAPENYSEEERKYDRLKN